jgi:hypothetical protein
MRIGWGLKGATDPPRKTPPISRLGNCSRLMRRRKALATSRSISLHERPLPSPPSNRRWRKANACIKCSAAWPATAPTAPSSARSARVGKASSAASATSPKGTKGKFKADEAYLRESILNPSAKVVKGFEKFDTGMPIYAGHLERLADREPDFVHQEFEVVRKERGAGSVQPSCSSKAACSFSGMVLFWAT